MSTPFKAGNDAETKGFVRSVHLLGRAPCSSSMVRVVPQLQLSQSCEILRPFVSAPSTGLEYSREAAQTEPGRSWTEGERLLPLKSGNLWRDDLAMGRELASSYGQRGDIGRNAAFRLQSVVSHPIGSGRTPPAFSRINWVSYSPLDSRTVPGFITTEKLPFAPLLGLPPGPLRQGGRHVREHGLPSARPGLAEEPQGRIPGAVGAVPKPPPAGVEARQEPHRSTESTSEVRNRGVHRDHQVQDLDQGGGVGEAFCVTRRLADLRVVRVGQRPAGPWPRASASALRPSTRPPRGTGLRRRSGTGSSRSEKG